jgi:eukaryotic-like serine/threonine-protein kinase
VQTEAEWQKIKYLFGEALERTPAERQAFLREACGENTSVREEVESLLKAHDSVGGMLERPADLAFPESMSVRSIGPYRLLEKIGEGGMGQVVRLRHLRDLRRVAHRPRPRLKDVNSTDTEIYSVVPIL